MSDSEKELADLHQKRVCLEDSCAALLDKLEDLDRYVQDVDDPFIAFTMIDVRERANSFVNDFIEFLSAVNKANDSLIDRMDTVQKTNALFIERIDEILRLVSSEPES